MAREHTKIDIPEQYIENEKKGLCRVCGKSIKRPFRKYCSIKCSMEYQKCFKTWTGLRDRVIARDKCCQICDSKSQLEVDHIDAIVNGGDMWDINNLRTLCHSCHIRKTKSDLYKRKYVKKGQKTVSDFNFSEKKKSLIRAKSQSNPTDLTPETSSQSLRGV